MWGSMSPTQSVGDQYYSKKCDRNGSPMWARPGYSGSFHLPGGDFPPGWGNFSRANIPEFARTPSHEGFLSISPREKFFGSPLTSVFFVEAGIPCERTRSKTCIFIDKINHCRNPFLPGRNYFPPGEMIQFREKCLYGR